MAFTDGAAPAPTQSTSYAAPSHSDLAAVAATVGIVGVLMAVLITWLVLRLRRPPDADAQSPAIPVAARRPASYVFRPSLAPSEASSKFGFIRKPLRLSHRRGDGSWDFADPDPAFHPKESPLDPPTPSPKRRPPPLTSTPAYTPRLSTHKDPYSPRTPTTPASIVQSPPPAYCRESAPWQAYHPKDLS